MIDISKWAFENKKLIYFLIAVLIVGGAYSSYEMSKLENFFISESIPATSIPVAPPPTITIFSIFIIMINSCV